MVWWEGVGERTVEIVADSTTEGGSRGEGGCLSVETSARQSDMQDGPWILPDWVGCLLLICWQCNPWAKYLAGRYVWLIAMRGTGGIDGPYCRTFNRVLDLLRESER